MVVKIDVSKCDGCGLCYEVCPVGGIKIENGKAIANEKCIDCMSCEAVCAKQALSSGLT